MNDVAAETRCEIIVEEMECPRPDGAAMAVRVARPKEKGPFPAVVDVHGGAWVAHDRHRNAVIDDFLAANGIVVAALEFRKPPEGAYPISIADIHLGIRWLKAKAVALGSRPDLVGGMGTSSGGHQLMLSALRPADPRYGALALREAPMMDATLRFAISCWGVVDPLARFRMVQQRQAKDLLDAHAAYWSDEAARLHQSACSRTGSTLKWCWTRARARRSMPIMRSVRSTWSKVKSRSQATVSKARAC